MTVRKSLLAAAVAAMALSSAAVAADQSNPVMLDASGPTSLTPTMYLLDSTSVGKWMEANKLSVSGFAEGGYFYDTNAPRMADDSPTRVVFPGGFSNRGVLDQLDLTIQKQIDTSKQWDFGFLFENGYGIDDAQIHSFGVFDHRGAAGAFNRAPASATGGATGAGVDPDNQ
jgi:opacity protein-like surface antigen